MAGLIADRMKSAPGAQESASKDGALTITPESVQQQLHLQPGQQEPLRRIVAAGQKVMYDAKTHDMVQQQLQQPGPLAKKMGEGVAALMVLLQKEASGALPHELLIPAGMALVAEAAKFVQDSQHEPVTDKDVAEAMNVFIGALLRAAGADPSKVAAMGARGAGQPAGEAPAQEAAEDPKEEATETPNQEKAEQPAPGEKEA